ncbi:MAG: MBL fold metallo-hydrolase [Planctomycetaceae bacterium]|nr:MBL fold metallo-hydrolase [Planctomycetaceae bacterium]
MNDYPPAAPGTLDAYWLGQAGFILRSDERLVVIDPYLSDVLAEKYRGTMFSHARMMPPPLAVDAALGADMLLSTHVHSDHLDPGLIRPFMQANPDCQFVCPASADDVALQRGAPPERLVTMDAGGRVAYSSLKVEAIPSAHEELAHNDRGEHLFLGYIIEMGGVRVYHSGDCVPYAGLADTLASRRLDAAFLPVNGRNEQRRDSGFAGNFTIREAGELCAAAGIPLLVPHHFGMFAFNTVAEDDIRAGLDGMAGLRYSLPRVDERLVIPPGRGGRG